MAQGAFLLLAGLFVAVTAGGFWVWTAIAVRLRRGQPLIPYQPRRMVPWGPVGFVLALLLVAQHLFFDSAELTHETLSELRDQMAAFSGIVLIFTGLGLGLLLLITRATPEDLGLPSTWRQFRSDVGWGLLVFLAVVVPVYTVHILLSPWKTSQHPILEMLQGHPDLGVLAVALFAAVVAAPIFEEFLFRLLLQGWLEKVEHRWMPKEISTAQSDTRSDHDTSFPATSPSGGVPPEPPTGSGQTEQQRHKLPRGTMPVVVSSLLFAMAHLGQGPDPIPLFLLALGIGYVYRQTHRLTPCIVVHMLFNGFSIGIVLIALKFSLR